MHTFSKCGVNWQAGKTGFRLAEFWRLAFVPEKPLIRTQRDTSQWLKKTDFFHGAINLLT